LNVHGVNEFKRKKDEHNCLIRQIEKVFRIEKNKNSKTKANNLKRKRFALL